MNSSLWILLYEFFMESWSRLNLVILSQSPFVILPPSFAFDQVPLGACAFLKRSNSFWIHEVIDEKSFSKLIESKPRRHHPLQTFWSQFEHPKSRSPLGSLRVHRIQFRSSKSDRYNQVVIFVNDYNLLIRRSIRQIVFISRFLSAVSLSCQPHCHSNLVHSPPNTGKYSKLPHLVEPHFFAMNKLESEWTLWI